MLGSSPTCLQGTVLYIEDVVGGGKKRCRKDKEDNKKQIGQLAKRRRKRNERKEPGEGKEEM
jgi:hypothetical protein